MESDDDLIPQWILEHVPSELVKSKAFRFQITLWVKDSENKHVKADVDMLNPTTLTMENLEEEMQELPAIYAFVSTLYSESRTVVAALERGMKARRGDAVRQIQEEAQHNKIKLTDAAVKQIVEADPELGKLDLRFQEGQMKVGKLYHLLEALKMKAELARSLAGFKRAELSNS